MSKHNNTCRTCKKRGASPLVHPSYCSFKKGVVKRDAVKCKEYVERKTGPEVLEELTGEQNG